MSYKPLTKKEIVEILVDFDIALNQADYLIQNDISKGKAKELAETFGLLDQFKLHQLDRGFIGSEEEG